MNWGNVKLILMREIRDQLRDRRTLFMIAVLPLLLYPLLGMSFFQLAQFMREHPTVVQIVGAAELDELKDLPPLLDSSRNRFSPDLFKTQQTASLMELKFAPPDTTPGEALAEAQRGVSEGRYEVALYFPPDFAERLTSFRERLIKADQTPGSTPPPEVPKPEIYFSKASDKSQLAYQRVKGALDEWNKEIGRKNLADSHISELAAQPFEYQLNDLSKVQQRAAVVWSKLLPFVLLIWALTGAFYPAIDLCAGEKERGTLETLLSSPAQRSEIVWGKLITVMIFSMATAILNLASLGTTGAFVLKQMEKMGAPGSLGDLSLPPPITFLWLFLTLIPISALFSALCLALAAFARSTKEGQYYLMPLVLVTMPLMVLPLSPGVELDLGRALIPITGIMLLLRTLMEGNYMLALPYVLPVALVTSFCCLAAIRWAIDQFNRESVLFRESERLDLTLWLRQLVSRRGDTPSAAESLVCFCLILIIQFVISLRFQNKLSFDWADATRMVFISQVVVIALPALLMAILFTGKPLKTLLLDRLPRWWTVPCAVLLAIAIHPTVQALGLIVQKVYPPSPDVLKAMEKVVKPLLDSPYPWLPFLLIAVFPAICEELAFRGFILSGLRHLGRKWWAIGLTAAFFGITHGMLQQSVMAALIGMLIGYLAVQTGSILPCMAFHVTNNSMVLVTGWIDEYYATTPWLENLVKKEADGANVHYVFHWWVLLAGAIVAGYIVTWLHRLQYQKTGEEQLQEALERQTEYSPPAGLAEPRA